MKMEVEINKKQNDHNYHESLKPRNGGVCSVPGLSYYTAPFASSPAYCNNPFACCDITYDATINLGGSAVRIFTPTSKFPPPACGPGDCC